MKKVIYLAVLAQTWADSYPFFIVPYLRALSAGQTVHQTVELVKAVRLQDDTTPIVFMTYLNPIMQYGFEKLVVHTENLIDGILILDAPYEYREQFKLRLTEKTCI